MKKVLLSNFLKQMEMEFLGLFTRKNHLIMKFAFMGAFCASILCYTQFLINGYGNPDTLNEAAITYVGTSWALTLGRWFTAIINNIAMRNVVMPVFSIIFNTCCQALTAIIISKLWKYENNSFIFLTAFLLTASPAVIAQNTYIYMTIAYGIALLCAALFAYFIMEKNSISASVLAVTFLILSLGSYQSYIGFATGLIVLTLIINTIKNDTEKFFQKVLRCGIFGVLACLIYILILKISLKIIGSSLASYSGADNISFLNSIDNIFSSFKNMYSGFLNYFINERILTFIIITFVIIMLTNVIKLLKMKKIFNALLICLMVVLIPVGMNLICLIVTEREISRLMSQQMQLIIPFVLCYLQQFLFKEKIRFIGKYCFIVVSVIICLNFVINAFATYKYIELSYTYVDKITSSALTHVYALDKYKTDMNIIPIGVPDETIVQKHNPLADKSYYKNRSAVFWNTNKTDISIWKNYLYLYHGVYTDYTSTEYKTIAISNEVKQMSCFPSKESVKIINGNVIIKFGEYTE